MTESNKSQPFTVRTLDFGNRTLIDYTAYEECETKLVKYKKALSICKIKIAKYILRDTKSYDKFREFEKEIDEVLK